MSAFRLNFERVERLRWLAIIGTMFHRRVRTLLIASFPALVAAALCIVGDLFEASASISDIHAGAADQRGNPNRQQDSEQGSMPDSVPRLHLDTPWSSAPVVRSSAPAVPTAKLLHRVASAASGTESDPPSPARLAVETEYLATALAVVAPPILPHAPPACAPRLGCC